MTQERCPPLPLVPVHFVHSEVHSWTDLAATDSGLISEDEYLQRTRCGRDNWIVQTCLMLRARGRKATLSDTPRPGCINIAHCDDIYPRKAWAIDHFIVGIRADRDPVFISQMEIHQNRALLKNDSQLFVPFWPQPRLIPRDPARGDRIENVMFAGLAKNLAASFRNSNFEQAVQKQGARLVICERGTWHDYREADVVLAVRDGTPYFLSIKPASKLVNAWHAGCPALLGAEPAYQELRQSDLDYFEVQTPEQALEAIRRLKADPSLYRRMVARGFERREQFTRDAIVSAWETAIDGPMAEQFRRWTEAPRVLRSLRPLAHSVAAVRRRLWGIQYNSGFDADGRRKRSAKLGRLRRLILAPRETLTVARLPCGT